MPGEHICVGGHGIVGEQGGVALMVEGMARLVELREEELVETDDLTNWSASWIGTDSSCVPSYKIPAGSLPTEVETEGATCSESAKSPSS